MNRISPEQAVVVVITPYLHFDGSSLLLERFLRWADLRRSDVLFDVLYRHDGPLRERLLALRNVRSVTPLLPRRRRILHHVETRLHARATAGRLRGASAIYCNTVLGLKCLEDLLNTLGIPQQQLPRVSVHVRELGYWITRSGVTTETFRRLADRIISDSQLTASNLRASLAIEGCVIDEYCDTQEVMRWRGCDRLREEFAIPKHRRIVGMSGTIEWRKGPDLFLQIARHLASTMESPPLLTWVGGGDAMNQYQVDSDIRRMSLESMIIFTGPKENPYPYYDSFDVFLLTSREEPFGAVCLEAGMLDIPSLCFAGCAGAESFISRAGGRVVTGFDAASMATAVKALLEDESGRRKAGERAHQVCLAAHALDVLLPRLLSEILGPQQGFSGGEVAKA